MLPASSRHTLPRARSPGGEGWDELASTGAHPWPAERRHLDFPWLGDFLSPWQGEDLEKSEVSVLDCFMEDGERAAGLVDGAGRGCDKKVLSWGGTSRWGGPGSS